MEKKIRELYPVKEVNEKTELSPIQKWYSGKNIFITGGTGFLGKMLIEKLLRSCSDIKTIYILVREKRGKNIHQRIEELLEDKIFERIKKEVPKCTHKLVAISGDCLQPGLGLSIQDTKILKTETNIVFHVAATVRFDEKLKLALTINVNSTRDILELCREMDNLKSVVHVSTAYSNCYLKTIDEIFYDYSFTTEDISMMLDKIDDKTAEQITPRLLGNWPNTYSLTKALGESIVRQYYHKLPLGMFRPAIITSTWKEPIRGWIDNYYGPTGICAAAMMGFLRSLYCDGDTHANIVPVDLCANALISTAWDVSENHKLGQCPIYNYVSSCDNPISWDEYSWLNTLYADKYPLMNSMKPPSIFNCNKNLFMHKINMFFYQFIPALLLDVFGLFFGKSPKVMKIHFKVTKLTEVVSYFSMRQWVFKNNNVNKLIDRMDGKDNEIFFMDMRRLDWLDYCRTYVLGIRRYLFKENDSNIQQARRRSHRLFLFTNVLKMLLSYFSVAALWWITYSLLRFSYSLLGI